MCGPIKFPLRIQIQILSEFGPSEWPKLDVKFRQGTSVPRPFYDLMLLFSVGIMCSLFGHDEGRRIHAVLLVHRICSPPRLMVEL